MQLKQAEQQLQEAVRKFKSGDGKAALLLTRQILQAGHEGVGVWELHSQASLAVGDLPSALNSIEKAIQQGGATLDRALFYGDLQLRAKQWQASANTFQQIIKQQDSNVTAWLGLAHCLLGSGDVSRAAQAYGAVLERDECHHDALLKLGICQLYMGDARQAMVCLQKLRDKSEGSAEVAYYYGEAARRASFVEDAIDVVWPHIKDPEWGSRISKTLIMCWLSTEKFDQAVELLDPLLAECPDDPELLSCKARLLSIEGKSREAFALADRVVERQPDNGAMWELYSSLLDHPMPESRLKQLQANIELLGAQKQERALAGLYFSAAHHYELSGKRSEEIENIHHANALLAKLDPYDNDLHKENVEAVRACYSRERIDSLTQQQSDDSFCPVFILCPPRSGSTLLEQALARHSKFQAAGEMNFLGDAWNELFNVRTVTLKPEQHKNLNSSQLEAFSAAYRSAMKDIGIEDSGWMVHKGINNHKVAGLLKAAFPQARFIDLRRDPMDVAFGCYKQNFESQKFSFTVEGCASEIRLFQDDMIWWYQQFPDAILPVEYAALVESFEHQIARILSWLGLEWEDSCLDFGRDSRVATASANQVRKGIFTKGVGRWKKYGDLLKPLVDALEEKGVTTQ